MRRRFMLHHFKCSAASISPAELAPRLSKHYLGPSINDISTILECLSPPFLVVTNTLAQLTRAIVCNWAKWPPLQCRRHLWMVPFADKIHFMSKLHIRYNHRTEMCPALYLALCYEKTAAELCATCRTRGRRWSQAMATLRSAVCKVNQK